MAMFLLFVFLAFVAIVGSVITFLASIWVGIKWCILLLMGGMLFVFDCCGDAEFEEEISLKKAIRGIMLGAGMIFLFVFIEQVFQKPFQDWVTYVAFLVGFFLFFILAVTLKLVKLYYVLIPLGFIWVIGYDLSYNVKPVESNIAYVEYVEGETSIHSVERWPEENECFVFDDYIFDAVYDDTIINKSHTLGPFKEGEKYYLAPDPKEEDPYWLKIIVGDTVGYIKDDDNVKRVYHRTSDQIDALQKQQIQSRWYRVLPGPVLKMCEFAYEHSGPLCQIDFAE